MAAHGSSGDGAGHASGQAIAGTRLHYHPFGERVNVKSDPVQYEFTGKERDDDTRLDSFGARYYASTLGRFPHPDIPGIDQSAGDPQRWNLFGYVQRPRAVKGVTTGSGAALPLMARTAVESRVGGKGAVAKFRTDQPILS